MLDQYHVCVALAVIILGISKTGFGGGIGILSIPLMAMVMPATQMLAVLAVLLVIVDLFANVHYLGEYDWPVLKWMLPGAVFGVLVGCGILLWMGKTTGNVDQKLALMIGILCIVFVAMQCYRLTGREIPTLPTKPASSVGIGALAGSVSTLSHSAGPIIILYLLQEKVDKRKLVGTMLLYTLLINSVKLVGYVTINQNVTLATVRQTLWMIPLLPIGTLTGVWMNKRLPEKPFTIIMYVAAALTAIQMIYKSLA